MTSSRSTLFGAAMIIAGMAIIGLNDNLVRFISPHGGLWQFQAARSGFALPLLVLVMRMQGRGFQVHAPGRLFWRTLAMTASIFLYFAAIPMIPIAHVGAGLFTAPIWVLIWSMLLFRMRVGPWRISAILLGFLGVLAILRPESGDFSIWALLPLAGGAFYGLANLLTREWCAQESPGVVTLTFFAAMGVAGVVIGAILSWADLAVNSDGAGFVLRGLNAAPWPFWFWSAVQALGALVGVGLLNRAYLGAETSALAVFEYSYLIFAGFWGYVLWQQNLGLNELAGIAMIIAAGAIIAWRGAGPVGAAVPAKPG